MIDSYYDEIKQLRENLKKAEEIIFTLRKQVKNLQKKVEELEKSAPPKIKALGGGYFMIGSNDGYNEPPTILGNRESKADKNKKRDN